MLKAPAEDGKWWTQHIIVKGNHVVVKIDDKTVVDFEEPADKKGADGKLREKLSEGTFAQILSAGSSSRPAECFFDRCK